MTEISPQIGLSKKKTNESAHKMDSPSIRLALGVAYMESHVI